MKTAVLAFGIFFGVYAWVLLMARRLSRRTAFSRHDDGTGFYRTPRRLVWGFFLPYFALLIAGVVLIAISSGRGAAWVAGLALILSAIVFRFTVGWLDRGRLTRRLPRGESP